MRNIETTDLVLRLVAVKIFLSRWDLNPRPSDYRSGALLTKLGDCTLPDDRREEGCWDAWPECNIAAHFQLTIRQVRRPNIVLDTQRGIYMLQENAIRLCVIAITLCVTFYK